MSLDNQRNLKLAIHRDPLFLAVAERCRRRDERVGAGVSRPADRRRLAPPARLHDADLSAARPASRRSAHPAADGSGFSASIVDVVALRRQQPRAAARRRVARSCSTCRRSRRPRRPRSGTTSSRRSRSHLGLPAGTIKTYVLVEQLEACFQLMEIRAALGPRFVGFNTGRWDYINSVSDAMAWDRDVRQPEHRRDHDDLRLHAALRGSRAPRGQHARSARPHRALAGRHGAEHSRRAPPPASPPAWHAPWPAPSASSAKAPAASGSPTGRWSTSSDRSGRRSAQDNQLGRDVSAAHLHGEDGATADARSSRRRARSAARAI